MQRNRLRNLPKTNLLKKYLWVVITLVLAFGFTACVNTSDNETSFDIDSTSNDESVISEIKYSEALVLLNDKEYSKAYTLLSSIEEYKDSAKLIDEIKVTIESEKAEKYYQEALQFIELEDYHKAIAKLERIDPYNDSSELLPELKYLYLLDNVNYEQYLQVDENYEDIKGYRDIDQLINDIKYNYAIELYKNKWFLEAKDFFSDVKDTHNVQPYLNSFYYKIEGVWDDQPGVLVTYKLDSFGKIVRNQYFKQILLWDKENENTYIDENLNSNNIKYKVEILEANNNIGGNLKIMHESYGMKIMPFISGEAPNQNTKPEPNTPIDQPKIELSSSKVYYWIQDRYEYYDIKYNNGEYSGDKYTAEVFSDAAAYFKATVIEVRKAYDAFRY